MSGSRWTHPSSEEGCVFPRWEAFLRAGKWPRRNLIKCKEALFSVKLDHCFRESRPVFPELRTAFCDLWGADRLKEDHGGSMSLGFWSFVCPSRDYFVTIFRRVSFWSSVFVHPGLERMWFLIEGCSLESEDHSYLQPAMICPFRCLRFWFELEMFSPERTLWSGHFLAVFFVTGARPDWASGRG